VPGKSVSYSAALKSFKNMLSFANLDPSLYALHSPRIGGASDAFRNGIPGYIIDSQGRWKCTSTKFHYLRIDEQDLVKKIKKSSSYN
jgi:hypothetical protein